MPSSASPSARKRFDYASLDAETTQFVQQQTGEIRVLMKRTAQGIVEVGQKLIEVKERLGHGRFLDWLEAEFEWHRDTANKFMHVALHFGPLGESKFSTIAPSALYLLAAPSTPESVREEAIARAEAGESITYTAAKTLKQKYAPPLTKSKLEPEPEPQLSPTPEPLPQFRDKPQIVAIRRGEQPIQSAQSLSLPQPSVPAPSQPGAWWQLGRQHLLYYGDPHSPEFLERIPENLGLLLAFPATHGWQSGILAETCITTIRYLPQGKDLRLFEEALETNLLLYSDVGDLVASCFLPSPEILSIVNRLDRRGLFAEPDSRRVNAVISDWKKAGLKAERLN